MTPGRLYLLAILCLVLAAILLFFGPDTGLTNILGAAATFLALLAYLLGLYLNRLGRRGEEALIALRSRIASVSGESIRGEHRTYHLSGLDELAKGGLLVVYEVADGWLLVPLLADLAWLKVPADGVDEVAMEEQGERGRNLAVKLRDEEGRALELRLASTLADRAARDLVLLQAALGK
jgi:hypothetical protein